jgi:AcrR family transcriptional regulator
MAEFSIEKALERAEAEPKSRRATLLRVAEALFAERGYDRVTVRDVADAAGVNVATLHLHWKNKATLYEAVCRLHAHYLLAFIERAQQDVAAEGLSPADRVARLVDHVFELFSQRPAVAPMALESVSGQAPPDLPTLFQHDIAVFQMVAAQIAKLMPADRARDVDPMLVLLGAFYFSIVAFSDSSLQQALLGGSVYRSEALQERLKKFARLALEGLVQ